MCFLKILSVNQQWGDRKVGGYGWLWVQSDEPHGSKVETTKKCPNGIFFERVDMARQRLGGVGGRRSRK